MQDAGFVPKIKPNQGNEKHKEEHMAQMVLDPKLLDTVEYTIWKDGSEWVCLASRLPFIDEVGGIGADPKEALQDCRSHLLYSFESFNR